jgi:cysteine desulfurase/selenocysteine lyase
MTTLQDIQALRSAFPLLNRQVNGRDLVYLDNAATTQKPRQVLEAMQHYYTHLNSNVHRGVHTLSQEATSAMEAVRDAFHKHLNAAHREEIIFVKGVTEGINLVAQGYASLLQTGDVVLVSSLEHHSNIVPWQWACERSGAQLKPIPLLPNQTLDLDAYRAMLREGSVRLVAVNHISNAVGTVNPVAELIALAHEHGAVVLVDGAQAGPHLRPDVAALDADFYVLSSHKMYGPTGIGLLYGKKALLEALPPYQGGGEMIKTVSFHGTTYADLPFKFEAGTPAIAEIIGLGAALDYVQAVGWETIHGIDADLMAYAGNMLRSIPGIHVWGPEDQHKLGVQSFSIQGVHPFDAGTILDQLGIAVRTGHHCAQPLMELLGVPGTLRASFALYNTRREVDLLGEALARAQRMLQ